MRFFRLLAAGNPRPHDYKSSALPTELTRRVRRNATARIDSVRKLSRAGFDSLSQFDTTRFYHTRAIDVEVPGFRYETPDTISYVSFDRLQVATADKKLVLTGLKYAPTMNEAEFYRRNCWVSAISGTSSNTCCPAARDAAIASK